MHRALSFRSLSTIVLMLALGAASACNSDENSPPATPTIVAVTASPTPPPASPTVAPRELTLRLQPPTPAAPVAGQTFTIIVRVEGAANLGAYQFSPTYDTAVLELISMQDSGFLASTGRPPSCNTEGASGAQATFYCLTIGSQPAGPSGDGNLALLEFRALQPGTTEITLERASATMPDATGLPTRVEPITVTATP